MTATRQCSDCTLCCKLLPVRELHKKAGERCDHQRLHGCSIYHKAGFPRSCLFWNCRWLVNDDTAELRRPDRSHYVVDVVPDFITITPNDGSAAPTNVEVVQIWVDPRHPDAWRDPALMAYIERRGVQGVASIIRWSSSDAMTVFPPAMSSDNAWHEVRGKIREQRTSAEIIEGVAQARRDVKVGETSDA